MTDAADNAIKPVNIANLDTNCASNVKPLTIRPINSEIDVTAIKVAGSAPTSKDRTKLGMKNSTWGTPRDIHITDRVMVINVGLQHSVKSKYFFIV